MASSLPSPLAAAIGVVPAVLDGVRRLPVRAIQLPVLAVSGALSTMDALRREYDDLAERGERLVARLRGEVIEQADELQDRVTDLVSRAPFATAPAAAPASASAFAPASGQTPTGAGAGFDRTPKHEAPTHQTPTHQTPTDEVPADEQPKGSPTPKAPEHSGARIETAASPAVVQTVEQIVARAAVDEAPLDHDELPLPDYDHMTLGSLRGRMRALSLQQLVQTRTYEKVHANRLPVVTMLDNRIAKLATGAGASTSGPVTTEPAPDVRTATPSAASVSPATTDAGQLAPVRGNATTPGR